MSQFQLPSSSTSAVSTPVIHSRYASDDDDDDNLPYPAELPRNDFLAPNFDPQTYLSTLRNRHQTLEDLRSDLRQRSQLLNKELLDLVNGNYEEFLSLGSDLKGGEEKVEGVRVGLLGFKREVEGIKKGVKQRAEEVASLVGERKAIRRDVMLGRNLLEVDEKISELEETMGIRLGAEDDEEEELDLEADEDESDSTVEGVQIKRLRAHAQQYIIIVKMIDRIGSDHPFLLGQKPRLESIRKTLLLDLAASLKQAKASKAADATLAVVRVYADIGAENEGVKVLKGG